MPATVDSGLKKCPWIKPCLGSSAWCREGTGGDNFPLGFPV